MIWANWFTTIILSPHLITLCTSFGHWWWVGLGGEMFLNMKIGFLADTMQKL